MDRCRSECITAASMVAGPPVTDCLGRGCVTSLVKRNESQPGPSEMRGARNSPPVSRTTHNAIRERGTHNGLKVAPDRWIVLSGNKQNGDERFRKIS
ncbi:hypothetical protein CEXT_469881 [Caerostris extrusa]|uniref:Uncharacterized protein n=1 Tax=Caerostris extrusa TaxID=172846 RepID=A0AAV4XWQ9_CAEEX|nr:hypothetical protein CEXT_469881 [Caerostris extrusa]